VALFLSLVYSVCAEADFEVEVNPVISEFEIDEYAEFNLDISNYNPFFDEYELVFPDDTRWSIEVSPQYYLSEIELAAESVTTATIKIKPLTNLRHGQYTYTATLKSVKTDEEVEFDMVFYIKSSDATYTGYVPSLNMDVDVLDKINPSEPVSLSINFRNRNMLNITDLEINISSSLIDDQTILTSIDPLEEKIEYFTLEFDPIQEPVYDNLTISIRAMHKLYSPLKKEIEIIAYSNLIEEEPSAESFLFRHEQNLIYINDGNVDTTKELTFETSLLRSLFTSTEPDADVIVEDGVRYLFLELDIPKQETVEVSIVVNYRPFFAIILLIILGIIAYYVFRSPVVVKKEAICLKREHEGISRLKVLVHVKNRTPKVIENVKIIDRLPHLAHLEKDVVVGTLAPEKVIKNQKHGTVLRWQLPHLEPFEERIITYTVKSKFKILGGFKLPSVVIKFKNKKNKFVKIYSNKPNVCDKK